MGYNKFWGSLRRNNVMNTARKEKIFLDKATFEKYAQAKMSELSNYAAIETLDGGRRKYSFDKIKTKEFYDYVGKEYCYKSNNKDGYYYMDNIKCSYNTADLYLRFEWIVVEWDKNGNHSQSRPAFL